VNDWHSGRRETSGKRDDEDGKTASLENCRGVADEEEYEGDEECGNGENEGKGWL
jgi:hypothetical protein